MHGYVQANPTDARQEAAGPALSTQSMSVMAPVASDRGAEAGALLQMRAALDHSPKVQSQLALQRALARPAPASPAVQQSGKLPLQMKRFALADVRGGTGVIQGKFKVPILDRFNALKIGRSQSAGIVDEKVHVAGVEVTQHFHCNGWEEKTREFDSFTGTFLINHKDPKYHYTITESDEKGAWQGDEPSQGAFGMKFRTLDKFKDLTKAEVAPAGAGGGAAGGGAGNPAVKK